jgi:hypothetical protein
MREQKWSGAKASKQALQVVLQLLGAPQGGLETRNRGSEVFDGNLRKPETRTTPRNQKSPSSAPKARKIWPFCETAIIRAEGAEKFGRFA